MRNKFFVLFLVSSLLASCAGREAQTVAVVQEGDFTRDCSSLELESQSIDSQVKTLITEHTKKQGSNTALTVVSVVIFLPALLALDLKGAAKAEYEALIERNTHLSNVAAKQGCAPIPVKDLDQYKQEIAAEKKAAAKAKSTGTLPASQRIR